MKIKTNKGIFYFYDMDQKTYRRIMFGEPEELYDFFVDQSKIILKRLVDMGGESKSPKDLKKKIIESQNKSGMVDNAHGVFNDEGYLEFEYEIVKKKKK